MNKVELVCGRICSGKGSYGKDPQINARIVVSDLVRALVKSTDRSKLQDTMYLDARIAEMIVDRIDKLMLMDMWHTIIVDGIRQSTIVEKVLEAYPEASLIWIEAPVEERKRRYEKRADEKDVEPFEVADNKPIELECQKIFDIFRDRLTIINNY